MCWWGWYLVLEQDLLDLLDRVLGQVNFTFVGIHVALEPDNQLAFLGFVLPEFNKLVDGHVFAVAGAVLSCNLPAQLNGALLVKTQDVQDALLELEWRRPLAVRD